jgi:hypothetical protein
MKTEQAPRGLGILPLLTIVFIVLKLTNNIDYSWYWVLSPILVPFLIIVLMIFIGFIRIKINKK